MTVLRSALLRFFLCVSAGLLAAIVCAAVCWIIVDAIVPVAANAGLAFFIKTWWASPSSSAFINIVDACALAQLFLVRTEPILIASIVFIGYRAGYQTRQFIAAGARPELSILFANFAITLLISIGVALLVLDFLPTVIPDVGSCSSTFLDRSGSRW